MSKSPSPPPSPTPRDRSPGGLPPVPDHVPYPKRSSGLITCGAIGAALSAIGVVSMAFFVTRTGVGLSFAGLLQFLGLMLTSFGMLGLREVFGRVAALAGFVVLCGMGTSIGGASVLFERDLEVEPVVLGLMLVGSHAVALAVAVAGSLSGDALPSALRRILATAGFVGGGLGVATTSLLLLDMPRPPSPTVALAASIGAAATAATLALLAIVFVQQRRLPA